MKQVEYRISHSGFDETCHFTWAKTKREITQKLRQSKKAQPNNIYTVYKIVVEEIDQQVDKPTTYRRTYEHVERIMRCQRNHG